MAVGHKQHEAVDRLVLEPVEMTCRVPVTEVARPAAQIPVSGSDEPTDAEEPPTHAATPRSRDPSSGWTAPPTRPTRAHPGPLDTRTTTASRPPSTHSVREPTITSGHLASRRTSF